MSDDEQQLDDFEGFIGLLPEAIASNPDQIFNESIEESGSIHEELEGVAEALKSLRGNSVSIHLKHYTLPLRISSYFIFIILLVV